MQEPSEIPSCAHEVERYGIRHAIGVILKATRRFAPDQPAPFDAGSRAIMRELAASGEADYPPPSGHRRPAWPQTAPRGPFLRNHPQTE